MSERRPKPQTLGAIAKAHMRPVASHPPEMDFQRWYTDMAQQYDLNPNPDDPTQFYDYRRAMMAGASPDEGGHWPSAFKREGHPNMVVGGFNVQTGQRVPGAPLARSVQELIDLGWEPATARQLWASVSR